MKIKRTVSIYSLLQIILLFGAAFAYGQVDTYTDETAYKNALQAAGYNSFEEGFEDDSVWGVARTPGSAENVTSSDIIWTSNHPLTNKITTGNGAVVTGNYGVYDPVHGYATDTGNCDIDNPPSECLFHDGVSGTWVQGPEVLVGVGGWFHGTLGADIAIVLNNTKQIGLGKLISNQNYFFGVIDTTGFTEFEIREIDSKVGDKLLIFADDFTFGMGVGVIVTNTFPWNLFLPAITNHPPAN